MREGRTAGETRLSARVRVEHEGSSLRFIVGPMRSVWALLSAPAAALITGAVLSNVVRQRVHDEVFAMTLGIALEGVLVWWWCWNLFGWQEMELRGDAVTITDHLLVGRRRRMFRVGEITAIRFNAPGHRVPPFVAFTLRDRGRQAFGEDLSRREGEAILDEIAKTMPGLRRLMKEDV